MKKYLMLAEVCFDWSHGEYSADCVPDIFLGIEEFENEIQAEARARVLLIKYCEDINKAKYIGASIYDSEVTVKEI